MSDHLARRWLPWFGAVVLSGWTQIASADEARVQVVPSPGCSPSPQAIERAVSDSVAGTIEGDPVVEVAFADRDGGTEARVSVSAAEHEVGHRRVVVASCDEAVDASVAIAALALSSTLPTEETAGDEALQVEPAPAQSVRTSQSADVDLTTAGISPATSVADVARPSPDSIGPDSIGPHRLSLAVGLDHGAMRGTIGVVELGASAPLPVGELRVSARYGGGVENEHSGESSYSRRSANFGAAAVSYCYRVGSNLSLSGCGGLELGVERVSWARQTQASRANGEEFLPSLRSTLGLIAALGGHTVQPELSVSAGHLSAGGSDDAAELALRATIGAAVSF